MMEQMTVHAMAVKYGGKFVDSYLKGIHLLSFYLAVCFNIWLSQVVNFSFPVFDFLRAQFEGHKECIIQMVSYDTSCTIYKLDFSLTPFCIESGERASEGHTNYTNPLFWSKG